MAARAADRRRARAVNGVNPSVARRARTSRRSVGVGQHGAFCVAEFSRAG